MKKTITVALGMILAIFLLYGCSRKEAIKVAGSTTVLPVVSKAAERFKMKHPDVNIIVNAGGSGVGINQLGERKIDIGMASRDITEAEMNQYPKANFVVHPIGIDAVVPVVSSEIYDAGIQTLTIEQVVCQIFVGIAIGHPLHHLWVDRRGLSWRLDRGAIRLAIRPYYFNSGPVAGYYGITDHHHAVG